MRKKSSYSEENFFSTNSAKVSEYLRQNPRLPKKMKSLKSKYPSPTVRTVGQLSCGGKNTFSTSPLGTQMIGGEPLRNLSEHDNPWSKLHRTFSSNHSPRNFPHAMQHPLNEPARFCSITDVKEEPSSEPQEPPVSLTHKTESGVQVNMFHCKECRRHIKYGKTFKLENSCSESDSENQLATIGCSNCERKQNMISPAKKITEDESSSEIEEQMHEQRTSLRDRDCSPCKCKPSTPRELKPPTPREHKRTTPTVHTVLMSGDGVLQGNENSSEYMKFTCGKKGPNQTWLTSIKVMTFLIVIAPVILHISDILNFMTTSSKFGNYLRNIITQEEIEEHSLIGWVLDVFFGVKGYAKPLPLFLYFF